MHISKNIALFVISSSSALIGCAGSSRPAAAPATTPVADLYTATDADTQALRSTEPLTSDRATLYINGMSCPLCVTNVDQQLMRVRGVSHSSVDLSTGKVVIEMPGNTKPSPKRLADAADDAGVTLVRIEAK